MKPLNPDAPAFLNCTGSLTVRAYFAGLAMQGLSAGGWGCSDEGDRSLIDRAIKRADTLIAALNKPTT